MNTTDVIVVNLNRPKETIATIKALLKANENINVILINNGSIQPVKFNGIEVINLKRNLGQAKAVNIGLAKTTSEYVCFMHNDIVINDKNWLDKAINFLKENENAGLIDVYGWKMINGKVKRITSLKGHERQRVLNPTSEFTEVFRTDEMANVFKNDGLRADERYEKTCCGIWIDILARKQKLYVIKLKNGSHSRTSERNKASQQYNRKNVRYQKLKESGLYGIKKFE